MCKLKEKSEIHILIFKQIFMNKTPFTQIKLSILITLNTNKKTLIDSFK